MITKFGDISNNGLDIGLKFKSLAVNKLGNHNSRKEGPIKNMEASTCTKDCIGKHGKNYPKNMMRKNSGLNILIMWLKKTRIGGKGSEMRIGGKSKFKKQSQPLINHKEQIGMKLMRKKKASEPVNNEHAKSYFEESLNTLGQIRFIRTCLCS